MSINQEFIDELDALIHYDLSSMQVGVKVHKNAGPTMISAMRRLHEKGLVTQSDGGYLTNLGVETVEHVQKLLSTLRAMNKEA